MYKRQDLAENGCDIIFATSFGQESYVFQAAAEYPDIQFCHATGTAASSSELTNVHDGIGPGSPRDDLSGTERRAGRPRSDFLGLEVASA